MQGMFRSNGGCGYVKKPDVLMKEGIDNEIFNPKADMPVKRTLKVRNLAYSKHEQKHYLPYIVFNLVSYLTGENIHGRRLAYGLQTNSL